MPRATDTAGAPGDSYLVQDQRTAIKSFVLSEMMRGAGYAALFVVSVGVFLWGIYLLGLLLPEDSKLAPPPMPYSAVQPLSPTTAST